MLATITTEGGTKKETVSELDYDGSFLDYRAKKFYKECDVVITNPPFGKTMFTPFINKVLECNKDFLIVAPDTSRNYSYIVNHLISGRFSIGYSRVTSLIEKSVYKGKRGNIGWLTSLTVNRNVPFLLLEKKYSPDEYPKYDNYDAIEVSKVADIPMDYDGVMGVPSTSFWDKYNREQFDIVKFRYGDDGKDLRVNGKCPFSRLLIKKNNSYGKL